MDINGLSLGGLVSPSRGSLKDTSNLAQRNQGNELPISNADVEKASSLDPSFVSRNDSALIDSQRRTSWNTQNAKWLVTFTLPQLSAHLQDSMVNVEAQARQVVGDKEWDVSINEDDELVIYGDDLTDGERKTLGALLQDAGVDQKMIDTRDMMITAFDTIQVDPDNSWRVDIFDHFTMDKASFGQVFRLRDHIDAAKKNFSVDDEHSFGVPGVRHLWGAADSLFNQIKQRGDLDGELPKGYVVPKGYVIDTHV